MAHRVVKKDRVLINSISSSLLCAIETHGQGDPYIRQVVK